MMPGAIGRGVDQVAQLLDDIRTLADPDELRRRHAELAAGTAKYNEAEAAAFAAQTESQQKIAQAAVDVEAAQKQREAADAHAEKRRREIANLERQTFAALQLREEQLNAVQADLDRRSAELDQRAAALAEQAKEIVRQRSEAVTRLHQADLTLDAAKQHEAETAALKAKHEEMVASINAFAKTLQPA